MRANQTCPEWARLSGNKLRHCERPGLTCLSHYNNISFSQNMTITLQLITDRFIPQYFPAGKTIGQYRG